MTGLEVSCTPKYILLFLMLLVVDARIVVVGCWDCFVVVDVVFTAVGC